MNKPSNIKKQNQMQSVLSPSWLSRVALQQPEWPNKGDLDLVLAEIKRMPPLVFAGEARSLMSKLANAQSGKAFLLQAGDCAESFYDFSADSIRDKLKVILQMAVILTYGAGVPVIKVGRIAGQFAKPRSNDVETLNGVSLPSFRGHMVNGEGFSQEERTPDPKRLLSAYHHSASTLNLLRAFAKGGFADLSQVHSWNREFVQSSGAGQRYESAANEIDRALRFMKACGIDLHTEATIQQVDFYTSHEALILEYEDALTRQDSLTDKIYGCSAHFLWAGERTRQVDGAHIEYLSSINNPIGVKIGPTATVDEIITLAKRLNPDNLPGRLTFITRFGAKKIKKLLPPILEAVAELELPVLWTCDPMHGNTFTTKDGIKTRHFDDVMDETKGFFEAHKKVGTWPGGIHVELTGDGVTECIGGETDTAEDQLVNRYTTICDPRLNARQAIDLSFRVAELLRP